MEANISLAAGGLRRGTIGRDSLLASLAASNPPYASVHVLQIPLVHGETKISNPGVLTFSARRAYSSHHTKIIAHQRCAVMLRIMVNMKNALAASAIL